MRAELFGVKGVPIRGGLLYLTTEKETVLASV